MDGIFGMGSWEYSEYQSKKRVLLLYIRSLSLTSTLEKNQKMFSLLA